MSKHQKSDQKNHMEMPVAESRLQNKWVRFGSLLIPCVTVWYLTTMLVLVGVSFGFERVKLERLHIGSATRVDWWSSFAAWDGEWYVGIVENGYTYDPNQMSSVAFFPAYPTLARAVKWVTGCRAEIALLSVSHLSMLGSFLALASYIKQRFPGEPLAVSDFALLSLGIFPTTFWMRMCYTESLFLFVLILAMLGMQRRWPPLAIAIVIGFATATRSAGVALLPVFWWWLLRNLQQQSLPRATLTAATLLPVSVWGLLAYVTYLHFTFGDPFVFTQTQIHWNERSH